MKIRIETRALSVETLKAIRADLERSGYDPELVKFLSDIIGKRSVVPDEPREVQPPQLGTQSHRVR